MKRSLTQLIGCALAIGVASAGWPAPVSTASEPSEAVGKLLRTMASGFHDSEDHAAIEQLIAALSDRARMTTAPEGPWVELTFNRAGALEVVEVHTERLLAAPPILQHAVILHELEHLKRAKDTRRALDELSQPAGGQEPGRDQGQPSDAAWRVREIVRILVDDEYRAYHREITYTEGVVKAAGGLKRYLNTLPPAQRRFIQEYYQRSVRPFIAAHGDLDELRLRRDLIFLKTFPRRYRRYYEAALAWEALQGHVEIRRGRGGMLYPTHLLAPAAFLAWLLP